jgi:hypothetical protein
MAPWRRAPCPNGGEGIFWGRAVFEAWQNSRDRLPPKIQRESAACQNTKGGAAPSKPKEPGGALKP